MKRGPQGEAHKITDSEQTAELWKTLAARSFRTYAKTPGSLVVNLAVLRVPFCAYKNCSGCLETPAISKPDQKLAMKLCLFVPAVKVPFSP